MAELDEIKKLSPDERIKRLKKLEEEKRKEIEEAEKLMKQSMGEIEHEEEIRQKIPVPQMKAVDINQLFTQEEKEVFAAKRYVQPAKKDDGQEKKAKNPAEKEESGLEAAVQSAPELADSRMEEQKQYGEALAMEQPSQLYQMARDAYDEFKETGQVDQARMYALDIATRAKEEASGGEYRAPTDEAQEQFGSVKSIIKYLRGR